MRKVPLCIPKVDVQEIEAVSKVLSSGWLAHGEMNKQLENDFAEYMGVKHAISMNSCTSCLHLAVEALGITGEVIVPSFTFVASANAIVKGGATPVFADIESQTYTLDPKKIESLITEKTQAIMPVHYAGQSCDMKAIMEIANRYGLKVIEDSAENIGGEFCGQKNGTFGVGCFSFFPTKNMTTGEGGMLTTDDDELARRVRALVGHGIEKTTHDRETMTRAWHRTATHIGYNFRMSNVLAAIGVEQLKKLEQMNEQRIQVAKWYREHLKEHPSVTLPYQRENTKHVYQMYVILLKEEIDRDDFVAQLNQEGIGASVHFFPSVHQMKIYKDFKKGDLSVTEDVNRRVVSLPIYPEMTEEDVLYVAERIRKRL